MVNNVIEKLVLQAKQGDKAAYVELIRLQYKRVYLLCYSIVGDEHHAEDLSQEAFMKGFTKLKDLRNPAQFDRWIGKIAKNLAITFLREKKVHVPLCENTFEHEPVESLQDRLCELNNAIRRLPVDLRTPLVMYYFDGRKVPAVAKTLGVSRSSVYLKLRTAISTLKELIQQGEVK